MFYPYEGGRGTRSVGTADGYLIGPKFLGNPLCSDRLPTMLQSAQFTKREILSSHVEAESAASLMQFRPSSFAVYKARSADLSRFSTD